jgi:hypothetical protein
MRFLDIHSCINIKVAVQLQVTRRANNWTVYYRSKRAKPPSVSMAIYSIAYNFTYLLKNSDLTALKEWHDLVSEQSTVRSTRAQSPENSGENSDAILTPSHSQIWRWGNTGSTTPGVGPAILLMSWILKTFLLSIEWLSWRVKEWAEKQKVCEGCIDKRATLLSCWWDPGKGNYCSIHSSKNQHLITATGTIYPKVAAMQ